jgi:putative nucleotidyltransferase with HDIG domain
MSEDVRNKLTELFGEELGWISDSGLREKTLAALAKAVEAGGWGAGDIEKLPFTLLIEGVEITLVEHTRAITRCARAAALEMLEVYGDRLEINIDQLVAGALLHDCGKFVEYERAKNGYVKSHLGRMLRHPFSGTAIAHAAGLPPEVCHIIAVHAGEGDGARATAEAIIVNHVDFANFEPFKL